MSMRSDLASRRAPKAPAPGGSVTRPVRGQRAVWLQTNAGPVALPEWAARRERRVRVPARGPQFSGAVEVVR